MGVIIGNDSRILSLYVSLGMIFCRKENMINQKKLCLVSISSYFGNCDLLNILDRYQKMIQTEFLSLYVSFSLETLPEGNTTNQNQLVSFSFVKSCWVIITGNDSRVLSLYNVRSNVGRKFGWVEEHASGMSDHRKLYVLSCIGNCYLLNILNRCHHWKWLKEIVSVGNMMKQEKLRLVLLYWKLLSSWMLLLECFETNFVSVLSAIWWYE